MSRTLSSAFVESVNASETTDVFIVLLRIDHPGLTNPIRITSDSVETTSNGDVYQPFPFQISLPKDDEDLGGSLAKLKIDAVDRAVIAAARQIRQQPTVRVQVIRAADPDTIEVEWPPFMLSNMQYDVQSLSGDLVLELLEQEPFPGKKMDPGLFPGLF